MAYRADIEIAVKGAQELKRLTDQINTASKAVDSLNSYIETFGGSGIVRSINTLRQAVSDAASAFDRAALNTDEATIAAKAYTQATRELNTGLQERIQLLKTIEQQERKQRLAAAGIREVTQYGGPIGPGPASSVLGGQSVPVSDKIARLLAQKRDERALDAALLELEIRKSEELNRQLQLRGELNAAAAREVSALLRARGMPQGFGISSLPLLPAARPGAPAMSGGARRRITGPVERLGGSRTADEAAAALRFAQALKEQVRPLSQIEALYGGIASQAGKLQTIKALPDSAMLNASARGIKSIETAQDKYNRKLKESADRLTEIDRLEEGRLRRAAKLAAIARATGTAGTLPGEATRRLGQVPAGGFPVAGPLESPGFQRTRGQVGRLGESLALGAGFPLLFGGGAGSVTGSVLGSFVGSGFGGQILGGALGQILDQAVQKTAKLGSALQTLNLSALEESGIRVNATLETQVTLLRQAGSAIEAQNLLQKEVLSVTGALPGTVEGISDAVNILGAAWNEFTAAAGVTLGIVGAPFVAALGAIFNGITIILKGLNVALSTVGAILKVTGEWVVKLFGGEQAVQNIRDSFASLNQEIEKSRKEYQPILAGLNSEVLLNREILNLEKQKSAANEVTDKNRNANITFQQAVLRINADTEQKIRDANAEITEYNKTQVQEKIRLLNVLREQSVEEARISLQLERQRIAIAEQEKAARAAEQARKAAEEAQKASLNIQRSLVDENLKNIDIIIRESEFTEGTEMSLRRSLQLTEARGRQIEQALSIERELALQEAAKNGTTQQTLKLYDKKLQNAQNELNLQTAIVERQLQQLQIQREIDRFQRQRRLEQDLAGLELPGTLSPIEQLARAQAGRREQLLGARFEELDQLQLKLSQTAGTFTDEQIKEYRNRLVEVNDEIGKLTNGLAQVEAAEITWERNRAGAESLQTVLNGLGSTITNVFSSLITNTEDFNSSLQNALRSLSNLLLQAAISGLAGTDGVGFFSFLAGGLKGRATGGPVTGRTPYIVGERGPELFVPNSSGNIVPNDRLGGSTSIVVNVDASGTDVQGNDQEGKELGRLIAVSIQQELIKQQRPGGLLAR